MAQAPLARIQGLTVLAKEAPIVAFTGGEAFNAAVKPLADFGSSFADMLMKQEGEKTQRLLVEEAVSRAVRRDDQGRLTWQPPDSDGTIPTEMAIAAGRAAYMSQVRADISSRGLEYKERYRFAPEKFKENFGLYINETIKNNAFSATPEGATTFRRLVEAEGATIGQEIFRGLQVEQAATSAKGARYQIGRGVDNIASEYLGLVYNGGASSGRAVELRSQHSALLQDAVKGGLIPSIQRDMAEDQLTKKAMVMQGMSQVRAVWERTKDKGAALREAWKLSKTYLSVVGKLDQPKLDAFLQTMGPQASPETKYKAIADFMGQRLSFEESREFYTAAKSDVTTNAEVYATIAADQIKAFTKEGLSRYLKSGNPSDATSYANEMAKKYAGTPVGDQYLRAGLALVQKVQSYVALGEKVTEQQATEFGDQIATETKGNTLAMMTRVFERADTMTDQKSRRVFLEAGAKYVQQLSAVGDLQKRLGFEQNRALYQRNFGDATAAIKDYYSGVRAGLIDPSRLPPPITNDQLQAGLGIRYHPDDVPKLIDLQRDEARATRIHAAEKGTSRANIVDSLKNGSVIPATDDNRKNLGRYIDQQHAKDAPMGLHPGNAAHHGHIMRYLDQGRLAWPSLVTNMDAALASGDRQTIGNAVRLFRTLKEQDGMGSVMSQFSGSALRTLGRTEAEIGLGDLTTDAQAKRVQEIQKAEASKVGWTDEEKTRSWEVVTNEANAKGVSPNELIDRHIGQALDEKWGPISKIWSGMTEWRDQGARMRTAMKDVSPEIRRQFREQFQYNLWRHGGNFDMAAKATRNELFGDEKTKGLYSVTDVFTFDNKPKLMFKPVDAQHPDQRAGGLFARTSLQRVAAAVGMEPADQRHYAPEVFALKMAEEQRAWLGLRPDGEMDHRLPRAEMERRRAIWQQQYGAFTGMDPKKLAERVVTPEFWLDQLRAGNIELDYDRSSDGAKVPQYKAKWRNGTGAVADLHSAHDDGRLRFSFEFERSPAGLRAKDQASTEAAAMVSRSWLGRRVMEFSEWVEPTERKAERVAKGEAMNRTGYWDEYPGDAEYFFKAIDESGWRRQHETAAKAWNEIGVKPRGIYGEQYGTEFSAFRESIYALHETFGRRLPGIDKIDIINQLDAQRAAEKLKPSSEWGNDPRLVIVKPPRASGVTGERMTQVFVEYGDGKRYPIPGNRATDFSVAKWQKWWNSTPLSKIREVEDLYGPDRTK